MSKRAAKQSLKTRDACMSSGSAFLAFFVATLEDLRCKPVSSCVPREPHGTRVCEAAGVVPGCATPSTLRFNRRPGVGGDLAPDSLSPNSAFDFPAWVSKEGAMTVDWKTQELAVYMLRELKPPASQEEVDELALKLQRAIEDEVEYLEDKREQRIRLVVG